MVTDCLGEVILWIGLHRLVIMFSGYRPPGYLWLLGYSVEAATVGSPMSCLGCGWLMGFMEKNRMWMKNNIEQQNSSCLSRFFWGVSGRVPNCPNLPFNFGAVCMGKIEDREQATNLGYVYCYIIHHQRFNFGVCHCDDTHPPSKPNEAPFFGKKNACSDSPQRVIPHRNGIWVWFKYVKIITSQKWMI